MHAYEHGRLDLPSVGHCTFAKRPPCLDWDTLDADVAVLVVPYDMGTQYRSGARFDLRSRLNNLYTRVLLNFLGYVFHEKGKGHPWSGEW